MIKFLSLLLTYWVSVSYTALISSILCDDPSYCSPWLDIEKKLKAHNLQVTCNQSTACLGITCEFQEYVSYLVGTLKLYFLILKVVKHISMCLNIC